MFVDVTEVIKQQFQIYPAPSHLVTVDEDRAIYLNPAPGGGGGIIPMGARGGSIPGGPLGGMPGIEPIGGLGGIIPGGGRAPVGGIGNPRANCCAADCAATKCKNNYKSNCGECNLMYENALTLH